MELSRSLFLYVVDDKSMEHVRAAFFLLRSGTIATLPILTL